MSRSILFTVVCLVGVASAANAAIVGTGAPGTGTPPTVVIGAGSHFSDFQKSFINQQATTAIALDAGQDFLKLTFWGRYRDNTTPIDDFTLRIWGPPTGLTSNVGDTLYNSSISPTRSVYGADGASNPYYEYSVDFSGSPIAIDQAGDYFISIVNNTSDASAWGWASKDSTLSRNDRGGETANWSTVSSGDLAFQSENTPEPGSIGVLSVAALGLAFGAWRRRKKGKQSER